MADKKLKIAIISAALFLAVNLTGCASPQNRIKIYVGMMRASSAEESAVFEECKRGFEQAYPRYEIISSPYVYSADTITAKYVSGQLPTVFEADASSVLGALDNGFIRDVAADLREIGWYDKADGYFLSEISDGGRVCGIPAEQYSAGMVLNLPLLCEAGIIESDGDGNYILYENGRAVYPDTFDKIERACEQIAAHSGGDTRGLFLSTDGENSGRIFTDIVYNFGSGDLEYEDADGSYRASFTNDGFGDAMRWVKNMSQLKYVDNSERYGVDDWAQMMSEGKTCFAFCLSNALTVNLSAYPALNGNIAFVPMPSADGVEPCAVWGGTVYAVSGLASDEQVKGVLAFLAYMGYGPDTDAQSTYFFERRISDLYDRNISVFPPLPVWNDAEYGKTTEEIYAKYSNVNAQYYGGYAENFDKIKRSGEPYERANLHYVINGLFEKMLFEATMSNIVTLLEESERDFNERYFKV